MSDRDPLRDEAQSAKPTARKVADRAPAATPSGLRDERAPEARAGPAHCASGATGDGPLECAIEAERLRLLQARAVLKCLHEVLLYRDDEESLVHAETVDVAATLVSEVIDSLDRVRLRPLLEQAKRSPRQDTLDAGVPHNKVEDAPPRYLC